MIFKNWKTGKVSGPDEVHVEIFKLVYLPDKIKEVVRVILKPYTTIP